MTKDSVQHILWEGKEKKVFDHQDLKHEPTPTVGNVTVIQPTQYIDKPAILPQGVKTTSQSTNVGIGNVNTPPSVGPGFKTKKKPAARVRRVTANKAGVTLPVPGNNPVSMVTPAGIPCTYCNRLFPSWFHLAVHIRTHTSQKP